MSNLILVLLFNAATNTFDLPPNLLSSLCYVESTHNVNAIHHDDGGSDSLGVCQIKYETAQWLGFEGSEKELMEPAVNVYYAAKFLAKQKSRYHGNIAKAIIAYNRGNAKGLTSTAYSVKVIKQWSIANAKDN
jgi:soluble lytic murein transglycosylase-like protein